MICAGKACSATFFVKGPSDPKPPPPGDLKGAVVAPLGGRPASFRRSIFLFQFGSEL